MTDFEIYALWKARHSSQPAPAPVGNGSVRFIDYDGTITRAYTPAEFAELTELPANPTHEGLTAQGWNWTLADAKEYVTANGALDIGQMYITDDGKTRLYISLEEGRLKPRLGIAINGTAVIDWGDDSITDTLTGSDLTTVEYNEHSYSVAGEYVVSIDVTGEFAFLGDATNGSQVLTKTGGDANSNKVYLNALKKIEFGENISEIGAHAFRNCTSIKEVAMPMTMTSIGANAFQLCMSIENVMIPKNITALSNSVFYQCHSLKRMSIPKDVSTIGASAFNSCYSLEKIDIPQKVYYIGANGFIACYAMSNMILSSRLTTLSVNVFQNCAAITSVTIPSAITTINANAFSGCYGLSFIKFEGSTPPTVADASAWTNIPTDCVIYVPTGSLSNYTSANNYPNSSTYAYREY